MSQDSIGHAVDDPVAEIVQQGGALGRGKRGRKVLLQLTLQVIGRFCGGLGRLAAQPGLKTANHQGRFFGGLDDGLLCGFRFVFRIFARCHFSPKPDYTLYYRTK